MTSIRWISEFMAIPIMLNLVANSIWRYLPTRWNLDIWISATLTLLALAIWHQSRRMPARGGMAPKTPLPPDSDGLDSAAARVAELRLRLIGARHHHDLDLVIAGIEAALAECELDPSSSPLSPRMASVRAELRRLHGQAMEARHPRAPVHCDVGDAAEYEVEARSPREERQLS